MALGPVEVVVLAFPDSNFNGAILPELARLIDTGTITLIDGVLATKDLEGDTVFVEYEDLDPETDAGKVAALMDRLEGLVSDEDVEHLTDALDPGSSAAILVFEHTWLKPLRDAIVSSGGILAADLRIPGLVVEEVLAAVAASE
jgi:Family of unknown function (DUF6325)